MDKSTAGAGFPVWATVLLIGLFCIPIGMQLLGFGTVVASVDASISNAPGALAVERSLPQVPDSAPPVIPEVGSNAELVAQQWMAWAGFWTTLLTATGIILIWRTLLATRQTLREAERATAAALATVAVTREIGEAQTSPFLMVMPGGKLWAKLENGRINFVLKLAIKNAGHTATRGATLSVQIFPTQRDAMELLAHSGRLHFRGLSNLGPMEPGGVFEFDDHFESTVEAVESRVRSNNPTAGNVDAAIFVVWVTMTWADYSERRSKPQAISLRTIAPLQLNLTTSGDLQLSYPKLRVQELLN